MPYVTKSMSFDGLSKYLDFGDVLGFERTEARSVSIWVKTSASAIGHLIGKIENSLASPGWALLIDATGKPYFDLINTFTGANYLQVGTSSVTVNNGSWRHLVLTYDGSSSAAGVRIYVDGVGAVLATYSDTLSASVLNTAAMSVGRRVAHPGALYGYSGNLSSAVLYNRVLTSSEAQELYNGGNPINPKLLASSKDAIVEVWPLGTGDTYPDVLGVNQAPTVPWTAGLKSPYRQAPNEVVPIEWFRGMGTRDMEPFYLGPGGTYGRFSTRSPALALYRAGPINRMEFTDPWSMSVWLKWTYTKSYGTIMGRADAGTGGGGYVLRTTSNVPGGLDVFLRATNQILVSTVTTTFNDGNWHHVVATYDGSVQNTGIHIWVDGVDEPLSLVSNALYGTWTDRSFCVGGSGDNPSTTYAFDGFLLQPAMYNRVLSGAEVAAIYNSGTPVDLSGLGSAGDLLSYWPIGESGTEGTSVDAVNGTLLNMDSSNVSTGPGGVLANALTFNGTDESIDYGNRFNFEYDQPFSIVFWFKTSFSGVSNFIFSNADATFRGYECWLLTTGEIVWSITNTSTTDRIRIDTTGTYNDGSWHQCVVTYDGSSSAATGMTIYVDGSVAASSVNIDSLTGTILDSGPFRIGQRGSNSQWFSGDLAGFHVFATELQAADVTALWNGGTPVDPTGLASAAYLVGYWQIGDGMYPGTMVGMSGADIVDDYPTVSTLATEKTWTTTVPSDIAYVSDLDQTQKYLLWLKNQLASTGWTVIGSSNGTVYEWAGTTAGGSYGGSSTGPYDVWAASSDVVWYDYDSGQGPHGWVVLQSPVTASGQFWLTISFLSRFNYHMRVYAANAKPTLPGTPLTYTPEPSTDEYFWIAGTDSGLDASDFAIQPYGFTALRAYFSGCAADGSFIIYNHVLNYSDWRVGYHFHVLGPDTDMEPDGGLPMRAVGLRWYDTGNDYDQYADWRIYAPFAGHTVRTSDNKVVGWGYYPSSEAWDLYNEDYLRQTMQVLPAVLVRYWSGAAVGGISGYPVCRVPDIYIHPDSAASQGDQAPAIGTPKYISVGGMWIPGSVVPVFT